MLLRHGLAQVIKLWDIRTLQCIQTIVDEVKHRPEDRFSSMCFDKDNNRLITATSILHSYDCVKAEDRGMKSHRSPICKALYNRTYDQVIRSCILFKSSLHVAA